MSNNPTINQSNIDDLIDEMYDVLEKGWRLPMSNGKVFVDGEEIRAILDDIKEEVPAELRDEAKSARQQAPPTQPWCRNLPKISL